MRGERKAQNENRHHWQKILRREWRHCEDQDYARELFALIGPEPVARRIPVLAYVPVGALFGLLGGLGVWLVTFAGPLSMREVFKEVAPFVGTGMGIGGAVGLWVGWRSTWGRFLEALPNAGVFPMLAGPLVGLVAGGLNGWLGNAVLAGLFVGAMLGVALGVTLGVVLGGLLGGLLGQLFGGLPIGELCNGPTASRLFGRLFWFVGRRRPLAAEVEAALRAVASGCSWIELLHQLDTLQQEPQDSRKWIAQLSGESWQEQFLARHALATLGGEAVEPLRAHDSPTARWLLKSIAAKTTQQFGSKAASLLCPRCLARCHQHRAPLKRGAITYYGCRLCRQSVEWLEAREVVAVLDNEMALPWRQRDGRLYVNALARGALCDCDRVAIVDATDDAVERFCMQVGNDTDDYRRPRYRTMPYEVGCPLSENTRRVLRHTFGGA